MSADEFRDTFRGSAIRRAKRSGLRRNAAIAMGNSGNKSFLPVLERLTTDEDQVVSETATWAATKLASSNSSAAILTR